MRPSSIDIITLKDIYDIYFDRVYGFYKTRLTNIEDAKDLTHDVFLKIGPNISKLENVKNLDAYLFTIARNVLIDYYKSVVRNLEISKVEEMYAPESEVRDINLEENMERLYAAIDSLPRSRKQILLRNKINGESTKEISKDLNLSVRTVENQIYRAIQALRKQMTSLFFFLF